MLTALFGSSGHEFETLHLKRCWKSEAVTQKCSAKTFFWKPSENSRKNIFDEVFLNNIADFLACNNNIKDSIMGVFLQILWNSSEQLVYSGSSQVFDRRCLCDKLKPSFLRRLLFNWSTFSRRVWSRGWSRYQVSTNQNSENSWCQIVRRNICQ